jgi:hypothetical protein
LRGGELGLERRRDASTERERGTFSPTDGNLHRCRRSTPARALSNGCKSSSPWRRVSREREGVGEEQMSGGACSRGVVRGFIWPVWSWCGVHLDGGDWASGAVLLERHREPCLVLGLAWSGAHCLHRGTVGFSSVARERVRGAACRVS